MHGFVATPGTRWPPIVRGCRFWHGFCVSRGMMCVIGHLGAKSGVVLATKNYGCKQVIRRLSLLIALFFVVGNNLYSESLQDDAFGPGSVYFQRWSAPVASAYLSGDLELDLYGLVTVGLAPRPRPGRLDSPYWEMSIPAFPINAPNLLTYLDRDNYQESETGTSEFLVDEYLYLGSLTISRFSLSRPGTGGYIHVNRWLGIGPVRLGWHWLPWRINGRTDALWGAGDPSVLEWIWYFSAPRVELSTNIHLFGFYSPVSVVPKVTFDVLDPGVVSFDIGVSLRRTSRAPRHETEL